MKKYILPMFIVICFFISGILTLSDYGINWDSPFNFQRGQAILHYIFTGKMNYTDLKKCKAPCIQSNGLQRSIYQDDQMNLSFIYKIDRVGGHPPLAGILASVSNIIFYQKLGVMDDIDSYNLFTLLASTMLVFIVAVWSTEVLGTFGGIVSTLSIALYPFFVAERNFNFKDPATSAFFIAAVYFFWLFVTRKKYVFIILSSIAAGISFAMKFNVVFLPFIFIPWVLVWGIYHGYKKKDWIKMLFVALAYPIIPLAIFLGTWPYTWHNPLKILLQTIGFYKQIGSGIQYQDASFYIVGINTYPAQFFLFTIPIITLILCLIGIVATFYFFRKQSTYFLWLLLLLVPLLRVTLPGFSSYGGIRQIAELLGGVALLSGLGAVILNNTIKKRSASFALAFQIIILCLFIPTIQALRTLHPNENLYFNQLVGGIVGARDRQLPGWNDTFGNSYYQGIQWINAHAEDHAQVAYPIQGTHNYVPFTKVRKDVLIGETLWSDTSKKGEYIIETNLDAALINKYAKQFELKTLLPVHTISVSNIPIGYIYKNDIKHTKEIYAKPEVDIAYEITQEDPMTYILTFNKSSTLTKILFNYSPTCADRPNGSISIVKNDNWLQLPEPIGEQYYTLPNFAMGGESNQLIYYIPYDVTDHVKITIFPSPCNLPISDIQVKGI